jgi:ABC-type phosphate transport system substrate-binding protein
MAQQKTVRASRGWPPGCLPAGRGLVEEALPMAPRRRIWLLVRVAIYLSVIVGLILYRGGIPWKQFKTALEGAGNEHPTLTVAGRDLAPTLLERLAVEYQHDYPALTFNLLPGGTNQALEALLSREADVAFTYRLPTAAEQELFRAADGDTAVVLSVGVGGLVLLAGSEAGTGPVTMAALAAALALPAGANAELPGGLAPFCERLYACDPNEGSWDAFRAGLGLAAAGDDNSGVAPAAGDRIIFLADPAAVVAAVANDPRSWGLVSTLDGGFDAAAGPPAGTRFVGVVAAEGKLPMSPNATNIASGDYPLHHFLYVACRGAGSLEGGKFLTHLATARGLRQVERGGVIPARMMARTIQLTRDPIGSGAQQGD